MQDRRDDSRPGQIALFLLTLAVLILCALVIQPFFPAILGAVVLAVVTQRPYDRLSIRIRNRTLCASVALVLVILAVIVPAFFLFQDIGEKAIATVTHLRSQAAQDRITDYIANRPSLASHIEAVTAAIDVNNAARTVAAWLGSKFAVLLGNSVRVITQLVVMLFILFFLYRDRQRALVALRSLLPLRDYETNDLLTRTGDTIFASALGRLTIAAIQGLLAAFAFWVLKVPNVLLWSVALTAFAMIPGFGAFLIWGPVAVWLGIHGHWGRATLLAIWGGVIVSTIDNILYPVLIGSRLRAHTGTILVSILGGIALFGISGIVMGPVVFTIADALLDIWRARADNPA